MKVQVLLPISILLSIGLLGTLKIRRKELDKEEKQKRFQDIKLRVTADVLDEYGRGLEEMKKQLDKAQADSKALQENVDLLNAEAEKKTGEVDACEGAQKSQTDEIAAGEVALNSLKANFGKEESSWKTEEEELKRQLAGRSSVCGFVKAASQAVRDLCGPEGIQLLSEEDAKAEAPKQEDAKAEAPKQEDNAHVPKKR